MNKKTNLKYIMVIILTSILSIELMLILINYVFAHLGTWTMSLSNKYLVINLTPIDKALITFFPVVPAFIHSIGEGININAFLKQSLWLFLSVILFFASGIGIGLLTWTTTSSISPLLPNYLKYQPFTYYWTLFLIPSILIPIVFPFLSKKQNKKN